jgi:aldehyde dehydrogenase (NAD+)
MEMEMTSGSTLRTYQLYIDGRWVAPQGGETFPTYNPYTQEPWALISQAGESDVRTAVDAARRAFDSTWQHTRGIERGRLLLRLAELLEPG